MCVCVLRAGTAVNPLLRAAYLSTDATRKVTLVLPWLSAADQERIFPANVSFDTPEQQEEYVRNWAKQRTGLDCNFKITFYPSRYAAEKGKAYDSMSRMHAGSVQLGAPVLCVQRLS